MIKSWYYIKDGNKQGPVLETELKLMASSGTLLPNDLVWSSGMVRWVQAHSIKSLFNKEPSAASESLGPPPLPPPLPLSQTNSSKETLKLIIDKSQFVWNGLSRNLKFGIVGGAAIFCLLMLIMIVSIAKSLVGPSTSAQQIAETYLKDRTGADTKYKNKTVTVSANILSVSDYVRLEIKGDSSSKIIVIAQFGTKDLEDFKRLPKGSDITFKASCSGVKENPKKTQLLLTFTTCELIRTTTTATSKTASQSGEKVEDLVEQVNKLTGSQPRQPSNPSPNQAASMFARHDAFSSKWEKYGTFKLYYPQGANEFKAAEAFRILGFPSEVLKAPRLPSNTSKYSPGNDWQEWVWMHNGTAIRCFVINMSALRTNRNKVEARPEDQITISSPGFLIGGDLDF
jgi:hypothetical protein